MNHAPLFLGVENGKLIIVDQWNRPNMVNNDSWAEFTDPELGEPYPEELNISYSVDLTRSRKMRSALIIDVHNLYQGSLKKFPGKVINYGELVTFFEGQGNDLFHKIAYGKQPVEKCRQFATMLQRNGFELYLGSTPHNIDMTLRVTQLVEDRALDHLILGTNYFEAGKILKFARSKGIYTTVFGFDLPSVFKDHAYMLELTPEFLQDRPKNETTESLDMHTDSTINPDGQVA